jgi:hypothetical protein
MCRWPLPAQSFSGPSSLGLATVFYCLRFETSLFVASYDSQGHGGGIRPRLHQFTNELSFITLGEPKREHHLEQFVYYSVILCLRNACQSRSFHAFTVFCLRIHGNVLSKQLVCRNQSLRGNALARSSQPLSSNGLFSHTIFMPP